MTNPHNGECHMSLTTYIEKLTKWSEVEESLFRSHLILNINLDEIEHEYYMNREER